MTDNETSELQPIIDALAFVRFTDRAIGNKFEAMLKELKRDLDEGNYEPSTDSEKALKELQAEVADALEKLDEDTPTTPASVDAEEEGEIILDLDEDEIENDDLDIDLGEGSDLTNESTG